MTRAFFAANWLSRQREKVARKSPRWLMKCLVGRTRWVDTIAPGEPTAIICVYAAR